MVYKLCSDGVKCYTSLVYDLVGDIRGQFFNMTTLTDGGITAHNNPRIVEGLIGKYNWC